MANLLVCGDREWTDHEYLGDILDGALRKLGPLALIDGGNPGVEEFAGAWAHHRKDVSHHKMKRDWRGFRKIPGVVRNRDLLSLEPWLVIVAYCGEKPSTGLNNLIELAQERGIETWLIQHPKK
jgi:hypothetical protein